MHGVVVFCRRGDVEKSFIQKCFVYLFVSIRLIKVHSLQTKHPVIVVATLGTTVLNGYDPLDAIADVCAKYKVWLHADVRSLTSIQQTTHFSHRFALEALRCTRASIVNC